MWYFYVNLLTRCIKNKCIDENGLIYLILTRKEAMEKFFESIEMPLKLREFDIPADCTEQLADLCTFGKQRTIPSFIDLDFNDVKNIFDSCY